MFGVGSGWTCGPDPPDESKTFALKTCKIAPFDVRAWDLLWVPRSRAICLSHVPRNALELAVAVVHTG
jgi:hypothetical protein